MYRVNVIDRHGAPELWGVTSFPVATIGAALDEAETCVSDLLDWPGLESVAFEANRWTVSGPSGYVIVTVEEEA